MSKYLVLFFIFSGSILYSQESTLLDDIYQIQLGTFSESVNFSQFDNISDLGRITVTSLRPEIEASLSDTTRVYIGIYLGKETATKVLQKVKKRGYQGAFLEAGNVGENITNDYHVIQVGAFNSLRMQVFEKINHDFYIACEKNMFKVFSFIYHPDQVTDTDKQFMLELGIEHGLKPFSRKLFIR